MTMDQKSFEGHTKLVISFLKQINTAYSNHDIQQNGKSFYRMTQQRMTAGLRYRHITIANDASRVTLQTVASL